MGRGLRYKTLRWKWVEEIEPSYVVAIKSGEILKGMTMAQVTVRMHSKQVNIFNTISCYFIVILLFRFVQFMIDLVV
jgi:hypothetical protein